MGVGAKRVLPLVPNGLRFQVRGLLTVDPVRACRALRRDGSRGRVAVILFGSNADTELLALRSIVDDVEADIGPVAWFHPDRIAGIPSLDGVDVVAVRLLGGVEAWPDGFAALR